MKHSFAKQVGWRTLTVAATLAVAPAISFAADGTAPPDGRIAYVTTDMYWGVYQTADGKAECPDGLNKYGPREVFAKLYPKGGTEVDTHLAREALKYYPEDSKDNFPMPEAKGPTAIGLNLDGKVGPNDFTSPTGEKGIDNSLFRVIGCSPQFRGPEGQFRLFGNRLVRQMTYNRSIIEISGVDSLKNDDSVQVTILRGLDPLLTDAGGDKIMPGGTQRVDNRFSKRFYNQLKGKIVDGVLQTEAKDVTWPWAVFFGNTNEYRFRGMQFQLKLTEEGRAEGLMAGYADVDTYYRTVMGWSTHHLSYGQLDPSGFYRKLWQRADGYPDQSGKMTAISSSVNIYMVQVYLDRGEPSITVSQSR
jgi:hypothetical protein